MTGTQAYILQRCTLIFRLMRDVNSETTTRDNGFKIYKDKSKSAIRNCYLLMYICILPDNCNTASVYMYR